MNRLGNHPHFHKVRRESLFLELGKFIDTPIEKVFYPYCWRDRRIELLFPEAEIIYVDDSAHLIGHAPIGKNARSHIIWESEYEHADTYDLVMFSRSGIGSFEENVYPRLRGGGYVVADNCFEAARSLHESGKLTLVWCSHHTQGWLQSGQCIDFLQAVTHDEEWEHTSCYRDAKGVRQIIHSKYSWIFGEDFPDESMTQWHRRIAKEVRQMHQSLHHSSDSEEIVRKVSEMPIIQHISRFPRTLPTKKEAVDDLFLFRKPI